MTFTIRHLGPGDEPVLALIAEEAPDFDLAGRSEPDRPLAAAEAAAYLADPSVLHWVAEKDGRVVGELLCHLLRLPSGAGRELLLYSIGVREADRRRGLGRALIRHMREWAEGHGVPEVWVLADNPPTSDSLGRGSSCCCDGGRADVGPRVNTSTLNADSLGRRTRGGLDAALSIEV